jgi:hypothetical protein
MMPMASCIILSRTCGSGQTLPITCSFNASPVPTPSQKRPGVMAPWVAAAWATTAG